MGVEKHDYCPFTHEIKTHIVHFRRSHTKYPSTASLTSPPCTPLHCTSIYSFEMQKPESPQDIMSDDWFTYKIAPDGDVIDGCHPDEAQALKDYLRHETTTAEAALAIIRPLVTASNPRGDLVRLWSILMDALVELPSEDTDRLIALVSVIENLPEPDFSAVEESKRPTEKLWKGLPGFGHLWADCHQWGSWRQTAVDLESEKRKLYRDEHIKKAEVEARLVASGLAGIEIDWAYEVIADALESSNALFDFEVPATAEWLVCCGRRLRQGAVRGETSWALKPRLSVVLWTSSRDLWQAHLDKVMSLKRWEAWRERLEELQSEGEDRVIRDAADRALKAMREADQVV
ncbi:hypothetical protein T440DRAFT_464511 [Plenodomus tracheiphilus IPT5]|uniref:Uncharacterized protein n=1 Tax=Plenodomus tracheiphilus IPT5 TaxID=1408161 RepID=A0A6A7BIU7_9PLEO|nr:hypothetical protein T440DRAFT_464511 [Plenodomus tracheiphilus IPT5]